MIQNGVLTYVGTTITTGKERGLEMIVKRHRFQKVFIAEWKGDKKKDKSVVMSYTSWWLLGIIPLYMKSEVEHFSI